MIQAAAGLHDRGHRVTTITRRSEALATHLASLGVESRFLPFRNLVDAGTILGLRRMIRELRPDVIHVHKGLAHWMALVAVTGNPIPALIVNRGVSFPLTPLNRGKYRSSRTDRIITVCDTIKQIIRTSGRIDPDKIEVVYAGTDMSRFDRSRVDPVRFRERESIPHDAFVVFQSGTRAWKGWREVVDAFDSIRSKIPAARLLIAGHDSDDRERLVRDYLSEKGLQGVVHVLGYRDDIEEVIAASDITVDASWEGTGITGTIRESMAIGTPVIATDCGGNRELLTRAELGWLIPPRDHDALVSALLEAAGDPDRRAAVARAAALQVRNTLSIERRIDRLEQIYAECVAARQSGSVTSARARTASRQG